MEPGYVKACRFFVLFAVLAALPATPASTQTVGCPPYPAYILLTNPGAEDYDPPYGQFEEVHLQGAAGWQRFWYGGPEPYWMDTRVFAYSHLGVGWVERIECETSQMIFSTEPYTAGIQQQFAVTPGLGYGFHAAMLTIFQTSAQPQEHDTMFKQVGMDPTGGTDPQAPSVVWSEPDGWDQGPWRVDLRTAAWAESPTMTVFIRVASPYPSGDPSFLNLSFLDSAILARTPSITAASPATTEVPTFTVSWTGIVPLPPDDGTLKWRDVQWLDEAEGQWHDWLTRTYASQATFFGERGHAYRFRARVWQRYTNGAHLVSPYRPEGDTRTVVQGPRLAGRVLTHDGRPAAGARLAVAGTSLAAGSGFDGSYELAVAPLPDPQSISLTHPSLPGPAPLYSVTFGLSETVPFTWTLRPARDWIANGEFEAGLDGWHALGPAVVTDAVHTGHGALALTGPEGLTYTAGVTQSLVLTDVWEPALSFWYNPAQIAGGDRFSVATTVITRGISATLPYTLTHVITPALDVPGWRPVVLYPGLPETAISGTLTIRFLFEHSVAGGPPGSVLLLDEVGLGATPGGPHKAYLPLVRKGS